MTQLFFVVEEGARSPRDGTVVWRMWAKHATQEEAVREAKQLPLARVLECREVWVTKAKEKP